jgi:class 3 adenylate cyclase/tetratricopeptide (TPR) repeat protein
MRECGSCHTLSPATARFCSECGNPLESAPPAAPATRSRQPSSSLGAERRQITVMFCDLVGSTALSSRLDPEDLRDLLSAYHDCVTRIADRFLGFIAQYLGDGALVYFGYPEAHEDDAERAIRAGLALAEEILQVKVGSEPLQIRVGIATGVTVVGDLFGSGAMQERGAIGETPNIAARLQGIAEPGTVVIAHSTRQLVGELFEMRDLGPITLKGMPEPINTWQILGENAVASRFEALRRRGTRLIGRRKELALLVQKWREAQSGSGRVVLVSGEAGLGKSRLTATFDQKAAAAATVRFYCSPLHKASALYPVIRELERAAGFQRTDTDAEKWSKLETFLRPVGALDGDVQVLGEFLNLSRDVRPPQQDLTPQQRRGKVFGLVLRYVQFLALSKSVLIVWEDLHWIDPTSQELLSVLVQEVRDLPVMILATFRPEMEPPWDQPHVTFITVTRLNASENSALATQIARNKKLPPELLEQIIEKTDGIPLFIEEFTKAVLETGLLTETDEQYELAGPLPEVAVPSTLEASLMARLDRLGAAREVAQISAVIGRDFPFDLLSAVAALPPPQLTEALEHLLDAGLLLPQGEPPEASYTFKHALLQEAAYASMLKSRRRAVHSKTAAVLEASFSNYAETQPEVLALHHAKAGQTRRAVEYLITAAGRSLDRSAALEAKKHAQKGLDLLAELPPEQSNSRLRVTLQLARGRSLIVLKGEHAEETGAAFREAREQCQQEDDPESVFQILDGLCVHYFSRREIVPTISTSQELLALGERTGSRAITITGLRAFGSASFLLGDFPRARQAFESLLELYCPTEDASLAMRTRTDPRVTSLAFLSLTAAIEGKPRSADQLSAASIESARQSAHPPSLTFALRLTAFLRALVEDWSGVLKSADEVLVISEKHGFPVWTIEGRFFRSMALFYLDGDRDALDGMKAALDTLTAGQAKWPFFLGAIAAAEAATGDLCSADQMFEEARRIALERNERWYYAELLRRKAEVHKHLSNAPEESESYLTEAIRVARDQGANLWALRSALSLAQLWSNSGRLHEASQILTPVCEEFSGQPWFAELSQAKQLLASLTN